MKQHNYVTKLDRLIEEGVIKREPGRVNHIDIKHDSWCGVHKGRLCNCDPAIDMRSEVTPP